MKKIKRSFSRFSKNQLIIGGIVLIILIIPLTILLSRQAQDQRSRAATPDKLETEAGVLSGAVTKLSDSLASGGQFVRFVSSQTSTPTPNPNTKYPPNTTLSKSFSVPSLSIPGYLSPVTEPTFGTKLTRVTDPSGFGGSTTIRHRYSKVSSWNLDGNYMVIQRYLLDGNTYQVIKTLPLSGEHRWSNTDPNKIFMITGSGSFRTYNINTNVTTAIRNFPGYDEVRMGPWEGNISRDDGMVVLGGRKGSDYTVIVFNIKENRVISTKTFPGKWDKGIDWASISPNGKYVIVNTSYCDPSCGDPVYTYDLNMNLLREISPGQHGDLVTDIDGNDYFVYVGGSGGITKSRVDTGVKTKLISQSTWGHISCRNILRPGWCYATMSNSSYREAIAFKLDGSGTVNRFAHHRSTQSVYATEAKGVVSMDGTKILWTSDWGKAGSFFDYVAESY